MKGANAVSGSVCLQRSCLMSTRQTMMKTQWKVLCLTMRRSLLAVNTQKRRKRRQQILLKLCVSNQSLSVLVPQTIKNHGENEVLTFF